MYRDTRTLCLSLLVLLAFLGLIAADCPKAPAQPQDRRTNKSLLKVATYNAEWLFLDTYNAASCPGSGCPWANYSEAVKHLYAVAEQLVIINADIVVIEEVRSCEVLIELAKVLSNGSMNAFYRNLKHKNPEKEPFEHEHERHEDDSEDKAKENLDLGYVPYLVQGTDTATGQNVGILTRIDPATNLNRTAQRYNYPISSSKCGYTGSPGDYGVSKHFFATFKVAGLNAPLLLIGGHLLAFPDRVDRCAQREAQASVLGDLVMRGLEDGYHVIATGDFNDYDPAVPDSSNNVAISQVLPILRNAFSEGSELTNSASFLQRSNRYSAWYSQTACIPLYSMIDHLLIDSVLASRVTFVEISHTYPAVCNDYNSDHWPVVVTIATSLSGLQNDEVEEWLSFVPTGLMGMVMLATFMCIIFGVKAVIDCYSRHKGNFFYPLRAEEEKN